MVDIPFTDILSRFVIVKLIWLKAIISLYICFKLLCNTKIQHLAYLIFIELQGNSQSRTRIKTTNEKPSDKSFNHLFELADFFIRLYR